MLNWNNLLIGRRRGTQRFISSKMRVLENVIKFSHRFRFPTFNTHFAFVWFLFFEKVENRSYDTFLSSFNLNGVHLTFKRFLFYLFVSTYRCRDLCTVAERMTFSIKHPKFQLTLFLSSSLRTNVILLINCSFK